MSVLTLTNDDTPSAPGAGKTALFTLPEGPQSIDAGGVEIGLAPSAYNYIRNSGFWFMQRGSGTFSNTGGGLGQVRTPTCDGWCIFNSATGVSVALYPSAGVAGVMSENIATYASFTKVTNAGRFAISQQIEANDADNLRGRTVRLSFWARAISTNAAPWRVLFARSTSGVNANTPIPLDTLSAVTVGADFTLVAPGRSYFAPRSDILPLNGVINGNGFTLGDLSTAVWRRYSAVWDIPTNVRALAFFLWSMSDVAINSGIQLAQVQLTVGAAFRPWTPLKQVGELRRVQRYYTKSFPITTTPATNAGLAGAVRGAASVAGAVANQPLGIRFPVPMIASANMDVITFYNPSAANAFARNTTAGSDATATTPSTYNENGVDVALTGIAAWAAGQSLALHYTRDSDF